MGTTRARRAGVLRYVALILAALLYLAPFLIQIATSFKTDPDASNHPLSLIPHPATLSVWRRVFGYSNQGGSVDFVRWLFNSAFISTSITLGRVFLDSLAGYALARLSFRGRAAILAFVIGVMAVPNVVLLIPRFLVLKELGLYSTYPGMILPIAADAAGIFIMRQFFLQIPVSLEEAAWVDGAGVWRTFWSVVMPLSRPGLITLTILSFQSSWNEFSFFLVANGDPNKYTLTTGLANLTSGSLGAGNQFPLNMGAALLTTIPVAIVFFLFQRQFTGNQFSAGVKG